MLSKETTVALKVYLEQNVYGKCSDYCVSVQIIHII